MLRRIYNAIVPAWKHTYKPPKDSSLRSKVVKPEPKWKPPSYKNYNWGKGVGK